MRCARSFPYGTNGQVSRRTDSTNWFQFNAREHSVMSSFLNVAGSVISTWKAMQRPVVGAFIFGSIAQRGYHAVGSDIELCIVTPNTPNPEWFEERIVSEEIGLFLKASDRG